MLDYDISLTRGHQFSFTLMTSTLPGLLISPWIQMEEILSTSPLSMSSLISLGLRPSTRHPTLNAVPKISFTPPLRLLLKLLNFIVLAISMISSSGIFPLCLIFFSFLRSRGGSFSARITSDDADGTTETWACRFCIVSFTVTRRPFQSPVAYIHKGLTWRRGDELPLQCLHRLFSGKDQGDRFLARGRMRNRLHRLELGGRWFWSHWDRFLEAWWLTDAWWEAKFRKDSPLRNTLILNFNSHSG